MSEKPTPDPSAVLEHTAWVQNELWASSMRARVAKDLRRALDATLKPLEAVEDTRALSSRPWGGSSLYQGGL